MATLPITPPPSLFFSHGYSPHFPSITASLSDQISSYFYRLADRTDRVFSAFNNQILSSYNSYGYFFYFRLAWYADILSKIQQLSLELRNRLIICSAICFIKIYTWKYPDDRKDHWNSEINRLCTLLFSGSSSLPLRVKEVMEIVNCQVSSQTSERYGKGLKGLNNAFLAGGKVVVILSYNQTTDTAYQQIQTAQDMVSLQKSMGERLFNLILLSETDGRTPIRCSVETHAFLLEKNNPLSNYQYQAETAVFEPNCHQGRSVGTQDTGKIEEYITTAKIRIEKSVPKYQVDQIHRFLHN